MEISAQVIAPRREHRGYQEHEDADPCENQDQPDQLPQQRLTSARYLRM
jgi:hypothetical protein